MADDLRPTTAVDRRQIKAATRRLSKLAGGAECACHVTRVGAPTLSKYGLLDHHEHFMPADIILDLEKDIGSPVVTAALAGLAGYRLVDAGGAAPGRGAHELGLPCIAAILANASALAGELDRSLADGRLEQVEADSIITVAEEAVRFLRNVQGRAREAVRR